MNTKTLNISLPPALIAQLDRVAKERSANRSELIREAVRRYVEDKNEWDAIFAYGRRKARELKLTEDDVVRIVREFREETQ